MYTPVAVFRVSYYKQHLSRFSFQYFLALITRGFIVFKTEFENLDN